MAKKKSLVSPSSNIRSATMQSPAGAEKGISPYDRIRDDLKNVYDDKIRETIISSAKSRESRDERKADKFRKKKSFVAPVR